MLCIASADNLSCPIVLRKNVLIRFNVEKQRSLSTVVIGIVHNMFSNFIDSEKVSQSLLLINS